MRQSVAWADLASELWIPATINTLARVLKDKVQLSLLKPSGSAVRSVKRNLRAKRAGENSHAPDGLFTVTPNSHGK